MKKESHGFSAEVVKHGSMKYVREFMGRPNIILFVMSVQCQLVRRIPFLTIGNVAGSNNQRRPLESFSEDCTCKVRFKQEVALWSTRGQGPAVMQRIASSPPTKANRVLCEMLEVRFKVEVPSAHASKQYTMRIEAVSRATAGAASDALAEVKAAAGAASDALAEVKAATVMMALFDAQVDPLLAGSWSSTIPGEMAAAGWRLHHRSPGRRRPGVASVWTTWSGYLSLSTTASSQLSASSSHNATNSAMIPSSAPC
ncbi:hypothetical protein PR048_024916 [Dryococelus australis]|uniref:Uncharacterized protein n=1 Tax=Dryococelus australis TaxID=614101 RepID=A0ABQ9GPW8_9NEOP|nr:hypothetical protein PR048_024916 [Dryococelus australis]